MTRPASRTARAAAVLSALFTALALPARAQNADFVWYGGSILAGRDARPEALAVKDGKIVALGTRADVEKKWKGKSTLPIDLNGQTLVAGLVPTPVPTPPPAAPPKGQAKSAARIEKPVRATPTPAPKPTPTPSQPREPAPPLEALGADVSPPPPGLPYTIASVRDALKMWVLRSSLPKRHRVVVGFGYDETKLAENRPPTREELDTVSATLPVIVVSKTGDAGAYNTLALQRAGISWRTKDPPGGTIVRRGRIQEPNGALTGSAHAAAFAKLVPRLDEKERARLHAESVRLNTPEEPEAAPAVAVVVQTPAPAPVPTPAPTPAVAAAATEPAPAARDAGSEALAALVADVLAGTSALEIGRPADMSVLSDDPAAADPARRAAIKVVEEVRKGRTVWRRDTTRR
ncbi:MAG: amidohydrolase family protein [Acidobacteria bacterium]|nr:amidohydrolase family protein [Acidobacteriota bacterium]